MIQAIYSLSAALALLQVGAQALRTVTEKILNLCSSLLQALINEERATLASMIELLFGKSSIEVFRIMLGLLVFVRFVFLGALLGSFAGAKIILATAWIVLSLICWALRVNKE